MNRIPAHKSGTAGQVVNPPDNFDMMDDQSDFAVKQRRNERLTLAQHYDVQRAKLDKKDGPYCYAGDYAGTYGGYTEAPKPTVRRVIKGMIRKIMLGY